MTQPHFEFNEDHVPLAYLITFRAYGTWLHGDERGSVDRFHNRYGTPRLPPNMPRKRYEKGLLKANPTRLGLKQRSAVEQAIRRLAPNANGFFGLLIFAQITCTQLSRPYVNLASF